MFAAARRGRSRPRLGPPRVPGIGPHPGQFGTARGTRDLRVGSGRGGWRHVQHRVAGVRRRSTRLFPSQAATNEWSVPGIPGNWRVSSPARGRHGADQPVRARGGMGRSRPASGTGDRRRPARHGATSLPSQGRARPASIRLGAAASRPPPGVAIRELSRSRRGPATRRSSRSSARRSPDCAAQAVPSAARTRTSGRPTAESSFRPRPRSERRTGCLSSRRSSRTGSVAAARLSTASGEQRWPRRPRAWTSPADEGWKAAEVAVAPSSGGTTVAGLPRRVPQGEPDSGYRCRNLDASARALGGGDEGAVRQPAAWSARGACHGRRRER